MNKYRQPAVTIEMTRAVRITSAEAPSVKFMVFATKGGNSLEIK